MRFSLVAPLLFAGVLVSCASGSLTNAQSACSDKSANFSAMWGCIRGRVASHTAGDMSGAEAVRYLAFGDALDEKFRAGRVSNADAKLLLAQELSRANIEYGQRTGGGGGSTTCQASGPYTVICY